MLKYLSSILTFIQNNSEINSNTNIINLMFSLKKIFYNQSYRNCSIGWQNLL